MITCRVEFRAIQPREGLVPATLVYDPADPAFIRMDLHGAETVSWLVGRDLLHAGLNGSAGLADVQIVSLAGRTLITLSSPSGQVILQAPTRRLVEVLEASWALIPAGEEWALLVDGILAEVMS